jgi:uncharacterized protein (DUF2235 family)
VLKDRAGRSRNIAVFIDGTWNRAGTRAPTNVRKLFEATPAGEAQRREQVKLYVPGVGKKPTADMGRLADADYEVELARHLRREMPPGTAALGRGLVGGVAGKGTAARIKATYHFLCKHYERRRSDRVFLFGFSRGAFAARSLAGFAGHVGVLLADKLEHVERAYEIYERSEDPAQTELADFLEQLTGVRMVAPDSQHSLPVHFLGVWDTVASLGLPSRLQWLSAPFTEYHQVNVPPSVMTARHALALHELRGLFEPLLWQAGTHGDVMQVWFAGAHADVGGGYEVGQAGLSDMALRWMAEEARRNGLAVDDQATWWTHWDERHSVHHEIRGTFLGTLPAARRWLELAEGEPWQSHHVHRSAIEYLQGVSPVSYGFSHPFVNAALRHVDSLVLPRAVRLALGGQDVVPLDDLAAGTSDRVAAYAVGDGVDWWTSVTPMELRSSADTIDKFLEGDGAPTAEDVEAFARAIALRQLFVDDSAVWRAADRAGDVMARVEREAIESSSVAAVGPWLLRGRAIDEGLAKGLRLMRPRERFEWVDAVRRFQMALGILRSDCISAAAREGLGADVTFRRLRL